MNLQVNGTRLHAVETGPEDGPPVVLVHGFPLDHRMWRHQLEGLSDRYRTIAYDVRGLGRSAVGDGQYTMELFADDLLGLLDALDTGPVRACGLSMGGYVVLRCLEREPERFRAAVLADTRAAADDDATRLSRARSIRTLKEEGVDAFADGLLEKILGRTTRSERPEVVEEVRTMVRENDPWGMAGAQLAMTSRTDTTDLLGRLTIPTLVVAGEEDELTPPDLARRMADAIPDGRVAVVAEAGHVTPLERPSAFQAELRAFLDGVTGGRASASPP